MRDAKLEKSDNFEHLRDDLDAILAEVARFARAG
jgi:hypothetical protein